MISSYLVLQTEPSNTISSKACEMFSGMTLLDSDRVLVLRKPIEGEWNDIPGKFQNTTVNLATAEPNCNNAKVACQDR